MGSRLGMRRDPCAVCGLPVFLAEKLVIARILYHRTCFRCARCKNQLTPGNYYETEEGQYCCETCPDEESPTPTLHQSYNEAIFHNNTPVSSPKDIYQKSLSDEEKIVKGIPEMMRSPQIASERITTPVSKMSDKLSAKLSDKISGKLSRENCLPTEMSLHTQQMRLNFMESHLLSEKLNELSVVDGPETFSSLSTSSEDSLKELSASPDDSASSSPKNEIEPDAENCDPINKTLDVEGRSFENQRLTAISSHDVDNKSLDVKKNTKDFIGEAAATSPSLVQQRLKMFESQEMNKWKGNTAISKKDVKLTDIDNNQSSSLENLQPRETLESRDHSKSIKNSESKEFSHLKEPPDLDFAKSDSKDDSNIDSKIEESETEQIDLRKLSLKKERLDGREPLQSEESSVARDDVADNCKSVEPLSPSDNDVIASSVSGMIIIEDNHSKSRIVQTESNLFTAKGINLSDVDDYPEALNPFADEDEQIVEDQRSNSKISTNPFDSEEDDEPSKIVSPPRAAERSVEMKKHHVEHVPVKRRLKAPHISLNPFFSDDDEAESDTEVRDKTIPLNAPVPKPRTIK